MVDDEPTISSTVERFLRHVLARDYESAYSLLAAGLRAGLSKTTFRRRFEDELAPLRPARFEVLRCHEDGDLGGAVAWLELDSGLRLGVEADLTRDDDGRWRIYFYDLQIDETWTQPPIGRGRNAGCEEDRPRRPLGSRIAERFRSRGLDEEILELRGQPARSTDLEP